MWPTRGGLKFWVQCLGLGFFWGACTGDIVPDNTPGAHEGSPGNVSLNGVMSPADPPPVAGAAAPPNMTAIPIGMDPTSGTVAMGAGPLRDESGYRVPERLSQTGLYSSIATRTVAPGRRLYRPSYELWSDAAEKSRWVYLPPGTQIDNHDRNHWAFPVGTQVWKEFRVEGRTIETRLLQRVGPGRDEFIYATYQWRDDGSDADYVSKGVTNASGTGHDIPSHAACLSCHGFLSEHVLGFSALLLSHNFEGVNLRALDAEHLLAVPEPVDIQVPGDATAQAALGYLHSNCGSCHNQAADQQAPLTGVQLPNRFSLRIDVDTATVGATDACTTGLNVPMSYSQANNIVSRLVGGGPELSGLYHRTALRGDTQMPPLATKLVDASGIRTLSSWIATLPGPSQGTGCANLR